MVKLRLAATPDQNAKLKTSDPEFLRRIRRYAALRAARRAMSAPLRIRPSDDAEGDTICMALEHLVANPSGDPERLVQELGGIDTVLARYARSLRASFSEVSIPQLRSTLPAVARQHRDEVIALVELLIEDDADVERNLAALDFVMTLLCFEDGYGRRQVTRDPVALSQRIRAVCERHQNAVEEAEIARLELRFYGFGELDIDRADVEHQIAELRGLKRELGSRFLHPRLLRAVVTYNVAVWNRLERFLETERASDPDWEAADGAEEADAGRSARSVDRPGEEFFLENSVVAAVAVCLKQRIHGDATPDSLIARIVKRLDLSRLGETELALLQGYDPSAGLGLRAGAILLGLLLEVIPVAADELEEAGLDPRVMHFEWVREVDGALRKLGKAALGEHDLEGACTISETRTQFIHEPLLFISKTLRDHYRPPKVEKKRRIRIRGVRLGRVLAREVLRSVDLPIWSMADLNAPRRRAPALLAVILCALVAWAVTREAPEGTLSDLTAAELASLSIFLENGYRDGRGQGPLFVGRVTERWQELSPGERRGEAEAIVGKLGARDVTQVMIYGPRRTLEVQSRSGRLVRPVEPSEAS